MKILILVVAEQLTWCRSDRCFCVVLHQILTLQFESSVDFKTKHFCPVLLSFNLSFLKSATPQGQTCCVLSISCINYTTFKLIQFGLQQMMFTMSRCLNPLSVPNKVANKGTISEEYTQPVLVILLALIANFRWLKTQLSFCLLVINTQLCPMQNRNHYERCIFFYHSFQKRNAGRLKINQMQRNIRKIVCTLVA